MNPTRFLRPILCCAAATVGLTALGGCQDDSKRVVLYCAQDKEFAEGVLGQFRDRTGLEAVPKFDTEADKSVSLVVELENEKERPRCDVFWNNEIVSTIRLRRQGPAGALRQPVVGRVPGVGPGQGPLLDGVRGPRPRAARQHRPAEDGGRAAEKPAGIDRREVEGPGRDGPAAVRHVGDAGGVSF